VLRREPGVVLCYGQTQWVDEEERPLEIGESDIDVNDEFPSDRFLRVRTQLVMNNMQCGVMRLDILRRTRLDRLYPSGDMALSAELALYGKLRLLPDVLALRRRSPDTFTSMLTPLERQRVYDPRAKAPITFIYARHHLDDVLSIARAPISVAERFRAYQVALKLAWWGRERLWREFVSVFGIGGAA
jgi:hypothetical protein